ncbi:hypothetical protein FWK35_00026565 [Aphis craccivora]|uniref:Uncharacterized protein n=1 Tax=Aphis craccivora TaxID=307492 RepID=A0A6G0Y7W8_APHCR|nr:hypothetical protein FWK35_00026565 [Aphis craccivora]
MFSPTNKSYVHSYSMLTSYGSSKLLWMPLGPWFIRNINLHTKTSKYQKYKTGSKFYPKMSIVTPLLSSTDSIYYNSYAKPFNAD